VENIRLVCRTHNVYLAEHDYGRAWMERYRRSPDRVSEPSPVFMAPVAAGDTRRNAVWSAHVRWGIIGACRIS
jgi:hypothetical protein